MTARKVLLLGEIGVGKSTMVQRLVFDRFEQSYKPTIGVDVYTYEVPDGPGRPRTTFIVWDTDGNFGETIFKHVYVRQASGAFILGDVTRRNTLATMVKLSEGFADAMPGRYQALLFNKSDLLEGSHAAAPLVTEFARSGLTTLVTSGKTGSNVREAFYDAAAVIARRGQ